MARKEAAAVRSLGTITKSSPHFLHLEKAHRQQRRLSTVTNKSINLVSKKKRKQMLSNQEKKD